MASDEIVWDVINNQFCSFKIKTPKNQNFCRNEHNVTGFCNKQSCPLANSRYATIRSNPTNGRLYLYIKSVERTHLPNRWWERIKLSGDYSKALAQLDTHLAYWPKFLVHKCKQRLTRLTQVAIRTRRLQKEEERLGERTVPRLAPKVRRREEGRERKAEAAARVERAIERELVERLRSGAYGDRPLNVDEAVWRKVLRGLERGGEGVRDEDLDEGIEEEQELEMEDEEGLGEVEYVSADEESDEEVDDLEDWLGGESPDEKDDTDGASEESGDEDEDEDGGDGDDAKLQKLLGNLKRKRLGEKAPKPSKKPAKRSKGPKREIEYELEKAPEAKEVAY